jgi:hypothetical protein
MITLLFRIQVLKWAERTDYYGVYEKWINTDFFEQFPNSVLLSIENIWVAVRDVFICLLI